MSPHNARALTRISRGKPTLTEGKTHMAENKKPLTKSQFLNEVAEAAGLKRKDIANVLIAITALAKKELNKKGLLQIPGFVKIKVVKKPATKQREGINPFTKEKITIKAKPASKAVRVRPVKALKELV